MEEQNISDLIKIDDYSYIEKCVLDIYLLFRPNATKEDILRFIHKK